MAKFESFFESPRGRIGKFAGLGAGDYWYSQGIAYDRYLVKMGFKISEGEPQVKNLQIIVQEILKVEIIEGGVVNSKIGETDYFLGYQALVKANSIDELFAQLHLDVVKDSPVENIVKKHEVF